MGNLRAGRRDEKVVHGRRSVLLLGREIGHRMLEVVLDDACSTAKFLKALSPQELRLTLGLDLPQPGHDELEIRRLDAVIGSYVADDSTTHRADLDSAGRDLVKDCCYEICLHLDPALRSNELVESVQWPKDRCLPTCTIQVLQPQPVREDVRDDRLERVE